MTEHEDAAARAGRWQRREARRRKQRERLQKHGASLRRVYIDAIKKRAGASKKGAD